MARLSSVLGMEYAAEPYILKYKCFHKPLEHTTRLFHFVSAETKVWESDCRKRGWWLAAPRSRSQAPGAGTRHDVTGGARRRLRELRPWAGPEAGLQAARRAPPHASGSLRLPGRGPRSRSWGRGASRPRPSGRSHPSGQPRSSCRGVAGRSARWALPVSSAW